MGADDSFERGRLEGRVATMEGDLRDIKEDQRRLFKGQEQIRISMAEIATIQREQAERTVSFMSQCAVCQGDQSSLREKVHSLENEVSTKAIQRKMSTAATQPLPEPEKPKGPLDKTIGEFLGDITVKALMVVGVAVVVALIGIGVANASL